MEPIILAPAAMAILAAVCLIAAINLTWSRRFVALQRGHQILHSTVLAQEEINRHLRLKISALEETISANERSIASQAEVADAEKAALERAIETAQRVGYLSSKSDEVLTQLGAVGATNNIVAALRSLSLQSAATPNKDSDNGNT